MERDIRNASWSRPIGALLGQVNGAVGDLLGDLFGALSPIAEKIGGFLGGIDDAVVGLIERVVTRVGGIVHGLGWVLENPFSGVHQILGWVRKLVGKIIPDDNNILKNLKEHFGGDEIKILDALLGAPRALAAWCARRCLTHHCACVFR